MTKIMVTGAGSLLGQGIIRCLKSSLSLARGHYVVALDPQPDLAVGCHWADCARRIPMASEESYLDALLETIDAERPDIVMIGTDAELPILAKYRNDIEVDHSTKVLVSSPAVVSVANDKYQTYVWMGANGFNPPDTAEYIGGVIHLDYPVVVKPRHGGRSRGVTVVPPRESFKPSPDVLHVIQEYIDGPEYTAGAVYFGGEVATIVMRRDLRDGNTYRAWVEPFLELNAKVAEWTLALKPWGPCNFQFRVDANGEPRCFEINARFSGTTPFRMLAGFNEVEMCIDYVMRGRPIRQPNIKPMTILRYWNEMAVSQCI
jgi:carbamoyl-phosphate synthase large subunit